MIVYTVVNNYPNSFSLEISESNVSYVTDNTDNNELAYLGITLSLRIESLPESDNPEQLNRIQFKVIALKFH